MRSFAPTAFAFESTLIALAAAGIPFTTHQRYSTAQPGLARARPLDEGLLANGLARVINVTVGNPPQNVGLIFDTGSSDTWFPSTSPGSTVCSSERQRGGHERSVCGDLGGFDETSSSTYSPLDEMGPFDVAYGDGTTISGSFFKDDLGIGGTRGITLRDNTMALATRGWSSLEIEGILGAGHSSLNAGKGSCSAKYPTVIEALQERGVIDTLAYSIYTNDFRTREGTVEFGAWDQTKFYGDMQVVPMVPNDFDGACSGTYNRHLLELTSFRFVNNGTGEERELLGPRSPSQSLTVLLDTGSSHTMLPESWIVPMFESFGVNPNGHLPCSAAVDGHFEFGFGHAKITVPLHQVIRPAAYISAGYDAPTTNEEEVCYFGIVPNAVPGGSFGGTKTLPMGVLGDTFLTSAYVIIDMTNNEIGLAQAWHNMTRVEDLVRITGKIPGVRNSGTGRPLVNF